MPNPFQIYSSASKSIIRRLGMSYLPGTHCLVPLFGRFISEHHFHMVTARERARTAGFLPLRRGQTQPRKGEGGREGRRAKLYLLRAESKIVAGTDAAGHQRAVIFRLDTAISIKNRYSELRGRMRTHPSSPTNSMKGLPNVCERKWNKENITFYGATEHG